MLAKGLALSQPSSSREIVLSNGSAKYDSLRKAAENLMRKQYSDKTDLEILTSRLRTTEQDKQDLLISNKKLLENKAKYEAVMQAEQSRTNKLRFDCIANQTMFASIQEVATNIRRKLKEEEEASVAALTSGKNLRLEFEACEQKLNQERGTNRELALKLEEHSSECARMRTERETVLEKMKEQNTVINSLNAEIAAVKSKLNEALVSVESAQNDRQLELDRLAQLKTAHQHSEITIKELKHSNLKQKEDIEAITKSKHNLESEFLQMKASEANLRIQLQRDISTLKESIAHKETEQQDLQQAKQLLQKELGEVQLAFGAAKERVQALEQKAEERTTELDTRRDQLAIATADNNKLLDTISKLESTLQDRLSTVEKLETETIDNQQELSRKDQDFHSLKQSLTTSERYVAEIQDQLSEASQKIELQEAEYRNLESVSQKLQEEIASLTKSVEGSKTKGANNRAAVEELTQKLTAKETELKAAKVDIVNLKDALYKQQRMSEEQVKLHGGDAAKTATIQQELNKYKLLLSESEKTMEKQNAELSEVKSQLAEETRLTSHANQTEEIEELKQLIDEQNKEMLSLKKQLQKTESAHSRAVPKVTGKRNPQADPLSSPVSAPPSPEDSQVQKKRKLLASTKYSPSTSTNPASSPKTRVRFSSPEPETGSNLSKKKPVAYSAKPRKVTQSAPKAKRSKKDEDEDFDVFEFRG